MGGFKEDKAVSRLCGVDRVDFTSFHQKLSKMLCKKQCPPKVKGGDKDFTENTTYYFTKPCSESTVKMVSELNPLLIPEALPLRE